MSARVPFTISYSLRDDNGKNHDLKVGKYDLRWSSLGVTCQIHMFSNISKIPCREIIAYSIRERGDATEADFWASTTLVSPHFAIQS